MWFRKKRLFSSSTSTGREVAPEDVLMDALNPGDFNADRMEGRIESALGRYPFAAAFVIAVLGVGAILTRVGYLQIAKGEEYALRARDNRFFAISLPAPRGIIYDTHKEPIVKNTPSFEVVLKRSELPESPEARKILAESLGEILGISLADLEEAGFDPGAFPDELPAELVISSDIRREDALKIQSQPKNLRGVIVRTRELRNYPGEAFTHVIGYVGQVDKAALGREEAYLPGDMIGKSGIEISYEKELRGEPGEQLVEVNSSGVALGELPQKKPVMGRSLVLNIDAGLQQAAYASLKRELEAHGRISGSAVVVDPRDGAVRALVSLPSFDPNRFRERLSQAAYEKLFLSSAKPLFNRVIGGVYPSGSVIKPMVAVAALEEKIIDPTRKIYDAGSISVPNPYRPGEETVFLDWKAHGWVDMRQALQWSANVYFYIVGGGYKDIKGLGIARLAEYMKKFGFGSELGIDLPGETTGLVPGPDTITKTRPRDPIWRIGDTYQTSIGQGAFQATPLQIAMMTSAIANGGTLWRPRVASAVLDGDGNIARTIAPEAIRANLADPKSIQVAREGMRLVATEGTARGYFSDFVVQVAGKTGTAQTGFQKNAHGWFAAFAPYDNPELVVVVVAEDVEYNMAIATPVTRDILYWYFTEGKQRQFAAKDKSAAPP